MISLYAATWPFQRVGWLPRTARVDYAFELMGAGQFAIDIPRNEFNAALVQPGAFVGIKSQYGLVDYVGFIERIEQSENEGALTITGKEWIGLLDERNTEQERTWQSGNAGNISSDIIRTASARNPIGIVVVPKIGAPLPAPFTVQATSVFNALNDLAALTGDEWVVRYAVGQTVTGVLTWQRPAGQDRRANVHIMGVVISEADYVSDLVSSSALVRVVGSIGDFKSRPSATVVANGPLALQDSVRYRSSLPAGSTIQSFRGVTKAREYVVVDAQLPGSLSVQERAIEELRAFINGAETISVVVSARQSWSVYNLGDIVTLHAPVLGAPRLFRIYGMQPRDDEGRMELVGKVLIDATG